MTKLTNEFEFEGFSTRASFNRSLKHFQAVNNLVDGISGRTNPAEVMVELLSGKSMEVHQILPMVKAVLTDKYRYLGFSVNMKKTVEDLSYLPAELGKWNAVDLVAVYHHPESGVMVINPKNPDHWASVGSLKVTELITLYVGALDKTAALLEDKKSRQLLDSAGKTFVALLESPKAKVPAALLEGAFKFIPAKKKSAAKDTEKKAPAARGRKPKAAAEPVQAVVMPTAVSATALPEKKSAVIQPAAPVAAGGRMVQSPKVGIQVTNELFHNGNVEAWKRIIDSYRSKYPANKVTVYYDGEVIHDINSLFKWGKVKHGTAILFSIAAPSAEEIKDISKMRKYLLEGASSRFEQFLRGPVGKILELF